ncbi:MAG: hypothetical protein L0Z50_41825 [Verrucomicrobiales bacterium]|nr:hypothetical protein [Verrucomicrobiales bacterium]
MGTKQATDLFPNLGGRIRLSCRDSQYRNSGVLQGRIYQTVQNTSLESFVCSIIQLNYRDKAQPRWMAQHKINILPGDAIERGLPPTPARIANRTDNGLGLRKPIKQPKRYRRNHEKRDTTKPTTTGVLKMWRLFEIIARI